MVPTPPGADEDEDDVAGRERDGGTGEKDDAHRQGAGVRPDARREQGPQGPGWRCVPAA